MSAFPTSLPGLYAIADEVCFSNASDSATALILFASELVSAGVRFLQYRNKDGNSRQMLGQARELRRLLGQRTRLIMNDRADLCVAAGFDGVHLGQDDVSAAGARAIFGRVLGKALWVGVSIHSIDQVAQAASGPVDYLAIGPVFPTRSKSNPDPVIGLEGVRAARAATSKPLVAIGGITRQNCRSVIDAGADSVAVISDLLASPAKSAEEFLRALG